jgi:HSP20 family protein
VSETEDAVQIRLDAPGYKAEEISIECTGDVIRISGQHKEEQSENGRTWHRVERRSGASQRELGLPMPIKEDQITAECVNGVLTVRMPKAETARTRKIKVKG